MAESAYPQSVQAGKPKLGELPIGYLQHHFGDLLFEEHRPIRLEDEEQYRLVTVKRSRGGLVERGIKKGKEISVKSQFEIRENDFLISKRQIVHGACCLVPKEFEGCIVSNEYAVLRTRDELDLTYLNYLSHTIYFQQTCFHSSIGVHIEKMIFKLNWWFKYQIHIPVLAEQQKIAAFLSTVDCKIEQLKRKKALLEQYKKGMMQKLFSQEIRFKDEKGNAFPEWVQVKLGDLAVFKKGKGIAKSDISENAENPCIRYGELYTTYSEIITDVKSRTEISAEGMMLSRHNDILMPTSDVTPSGLATASALNTEGVILGGDILIIRSKKILNSYFCYFVSAHKKEIIRLVTGITVS
jgi:type I restriction enzyme S subunit